MIVSVYERKKLKRLTDKGIVVETLYYNVNQKKGQIYVRATDGQMLESITDKAIKEKRYFKNNECIYRKTDFNPRIHYTIKTYDNEEEKIKCPNCGNTGKIADFIDNCPYCNTSFNFGINNINESKREKIYTILSPIFWTIYILLLLISQIITVYTLGKEALIISIYFSSIFLFFICFLVLTIIRNKNNYQALSKKDKKNIWKSEKNENTFYNDMYKEILSYLYKQKDLIDFDIVEYNGLKFEGEDIIRISCTIRKIIYNEKIEEKTSTLELKMIYQEIKKIKDNYKIINCHNCGASIDISKKECPHCETPININSEWIIEEIKEK